MNRIALASLLAVSFPCAAVAQPRPRDAKPADPKAAPAKAGSCNSVKLTTSMGPITIALDAAKAPNTVANFQQYVKSGHYNGTIFHRVIDGFMARGGGSTKNMTKKPTQKPIAIESSNGLKNEP